MSRGRQRKKYLSLVITFILSHQLFLSALSVCRADGALILDLKQSLEIALENNQQLLAARGNIKKGRAVIEENSASAYPELKASADYTRLGNIDEVMLPAYKAGHAVSTSLRRQGREMFITNFAIKRASAVFVLVIVIVFAGTTSYLNLPREASPDITIPYIIVSTPYFGVSPADIEHLVTQPIEKELKGIGHVKEIRSASNEGLSSITIEFEPNTDIDSAFQKVRDKVDQAKPDLPADAEEPIITEVNFSSLPIMIINISS